MVGIVLCFLPVSSVGKQNSKVANNVQVAKYLYISKIPNNTDILTSKVPEM